MFLCRACSAKKCIAPGQHFVFYPRTAELFGLLGVFLAVPAAALVQIVIDEFYLQPRKIDAAALDREAAALVEGRK